ncbi:MAG: PEGA domain-containing protein [bacterium]|nr:PEGA domain-containing protein [bacterium]MCM1374467.1 PEGA domain-containing protein [Muribaculum sp.]
MGEGRKRVITGILMVAGLAIFAAACGRQGGSPTRPPASPTPDSRQQGTGFVVAGPHSYDSADTAVLIKKDGKEGTVTLLNLNVGRTYTLSVEGTSYLYDKYGEAVSLEQIVPGDIVDVTFLRSKKRLNTMQLSPSSWVNASASRYEIDLKRREVTIGEDVYKLTKDTIYLSEGMRIEAMDLNPADVLTFKGLGSSILSINVEQGHGYLRLQNDENFIGGFMEIGQSTIRRIEEDMLLTVPEGSYQVNISKRGGGGTKQVTIRRGEETALDIGDLEVPEVQYGTVLFTLNPSQAKLYIDGEKVDPSEPVSLEYGIHQLIVKSNGYKTTTTYIRVAQPSGGLDITLDAVDDDDDSDDQEKKDKLAQYKVFVDAPENAEVYLDGNYMGIAPMSFTKTDGSHIITLRRSGYETRSYTVSIDSEYKDITYSFAELIPGSSGESASATPSPTPQPTSTPAP